MNRGLAAQVFVIKFRFHGDLPFFLGSQLRSSLIERPLREKTSVKDAIESCGVPHPEVDLILLNGAPVAFSHPLTSDGQIDVFPALTAPALFPQSRLQRRGLKRFVADGHLGKLTRSLRLLGFDVLYDNRATDAALLALIAQDDRVLLTRDRRLLMHAVVRHGYCPRSHNPEEQIIEVIRRFDLARLIAPYSRCLQCNGLLEGVNKADVLERLEPLTKIYYQNFRRCSVCGKIYWPGSHFGKLQNRLERIRSELN